jgi:hypothetical protein
MDTCARMHRDTGTAAVKDLRGRGRPVASQDATPGQLTVADHGRYELFAAFQRNNSPIAVG